MAAPRPDEHFYKQLTIKEATSTEASHRSKDRIQKSSHEERKKMTNEKMTKIIGVRHVGLIAQNPAVLADFYHDVLALEIVSTDTAALGPTAFLSSQPEEGSVDLVFFANSALQHTAFEVSSLANLRAFHQRIIDRRVPINVVGTHVLSLAR